MSWGIGASRRFTLRACGRLFYLPKGDPTRKNRRMTGAGLITSRLMQEFGSG